MANNYIRLHIAGFWTNKKPLKISGFIIVGSNSLQLIAIYHLPMQNLLKILESTSLLVTSPNISDR